MSLLFSRIEANGNPNDDFFAAYIGILYSLSYGIKMSRKKGIDPKGYFDYTIYPPEGIWDLRVSVEKNEMETIHLSQIQPSEHFEDGY